MKAMNAKPKPMPNKSFHNPGLIFAIFLVYRELLNRIK